MTTGNVDWNGTLQVVLQVPGVGSGTLPGARGGQLSSPAINDMSNHLRRLAGDSAKQGSTFDRSLAKVGIKFNLAAILKQSQIFTSTLGSLFQIFGAVADIVLAAFMPILIPAIRWIASSLPEIKESVQKTIGNVIDILFRIRDKAESMASFGQQSASNGLQAMGMNKTMADALTTMQHDQAILGLGVGGQALGQALGDKKGGAFSAKWGKRSVAGVGAVELWSWANAGFPLDQAPEAAMQVGGSAAAFFGGGKVRTAGWIGMVAGELYEHFREAFEGNNNNNTSNGGNGVAVDKDGFTEQVLKVTTNAWDSTMGWVGGGEDNN